MSTIIGISVSSKDYHCERRFLEATQTLQKKKKKKRILVFKPLRKNIY